MALLAESGCPPNATPGLARDHSKENDARGEPPAQGAHYDIVMILSKFSGLSLELAGFYWLVR